MERIKSILQRKEPVKWLFYGDSITQGARHLFGARDYTEHFSERVRTEMGRFQDIVIKTAISGNTTRNLLEDFDWRVAQFRPDVVFLMIGMNDCSTGRKMPLEEFRGNLLRLVDKIEALGGLTVLQTTCPILPGTAPDREGNFPAFMQVIRDVAADKQLPLVDHLEFWAAHADRHFIWMSNAFHPNDAGHLAFARHLFREVGIYAENSTTCQFFLP